MTYLNLPREARLKMMDIANKGNRKGLTALLEITIRRLIERGEFPKPQRYAAMPRSTFFIYGEILGWMDKQNGRNAEDWWMGTKKPTPKGSLAHESDAQIVADYCQGLFAARKARWEAAR